MAGRKDQYGITREQLVDLHHEQNKTPKEIAEYFGCSYALILHKLRKFGIKKLPKSERLKGQRFGKLYVESFSHYDEKRMAIWKTRCDCGAVVYISSGRLKFNKQCLDCGRSNQRTHNKSRSRLYKIWQGMRTRCSNPNAINYKDYGGRGIAYDPKWDNFENFLADMGPTYQEGLTLDRIDNDGNYTKENCKWSTLKQQGFNKRNNTILAYNGKKQTVMQWADEFNIDCHRMYSLRSSHPNWSDEKIINEALRRSKHA